MTSIHPPYITGAEAAQLLGYATPSAFTRLLRTPTTCPPGAYKAGHTWMIPIEWVLAKKEEEERAGIVRTGKMGRPVTTGAGIRRKDRGGPGGKEPTK